MTVGTEGVRALGGFVDALDECDTVDLYNYAVEFLESLSAYSAVSRGKASRFLVTYAKLLLRASNPGISYSRNGAESRF